jgi:putative SbcD/Mre11-related phosphoesterase
MKTVSALKTVTSALQSSLSEMDHSKHEFAPGMWSDARRALWIPEASLLAVADLHLGYAWAHRHAGQLMPITARDTTPERLRALVDDYKPQRLVLLGDIVHRAVPVNPVREALLAVLDCLPPQLAVTAVAGNHDRDIENLLRADNRFVPVTHYCASGCVFVHGDAASVVAAESDIKAAKAKRGWVIIGHEHPSVTLGDGVATWEKYPCFLVCDGLLVLPAFSQWAAGNSRDEFMSPLLECTEIKLKVGIVGDRLLPISDG